MKEHNRAGTRCLFFLLIFTCIIHPPLYAADLDELASAIVYLRGPKEAGSGFLLATEHTPYLVTADHVSRIVTGSSDVVLRGPEDRPIRFKLEDLHGDPKLAWLRHKEADVAVLRLKLTGAPLKAVERHFLPISFLVREDTAPARKYWLAAMGFPLNLGVETRFSPLSRRTHASSGLLRFQRFDTRTWTTFFVLEDPSVQGYSGGPVFQMPWPPQEGSGISIGGRETRIVGVVHGTINDVTGGKLAAVTPAMFLAELIDAAEQEDSK